MGSHPMTPKRREVCVRLGESSSRREIACERSHLLRQKLAVDPSFDLDRGGRVAVAEAVDGLERDRAVLRRLSFLQAERLLEPSDRCVARRGKARRPLAHLDARAPAPHKAEIAVIGRDAVHDGFRLPDGVRDARDVLVGDQPVLVHHLLEALQGVVRRAKILCLRSWTRLSLTRKVYPEGR